jgi:hypothetical protein
VSSRTMMPMFFEFIAEWPECKLKIRIWTTPIFARLTGAWASLIDGWGKERLHSCPPHAQGELAITMPRLRSSSSTALLLWAIAESALRCGPLEYNEQRNA